MHRGTEVRGRSIMRERAQARQPRRCLLAVSGLGWVGANLPPNRIAGGRRPGGGGHGEAGGPMLELWGSPV